VDYEQIIRRAYKMAEEVDIPGFVGSFTEDGTFTDMSIQVVYKGPDELGKTRGELRQGVPRYATANFLRSTRSTNIVVVQLALQGTHLGPLHLPAGILPPTGNRMDAPCCDVFELVGDKIKRFDCYPSGTVVLTQLGVFSNLEAHSNTDCRAADEHLMILEASCPKKRIRSATACR